MKALKLWFDQHKRSFPFRENKTAYSVLVSEIMLQQTRAEVVVPYFIRWMKRFPTLKDLARASFDDVLKMWEGLGYYRRAKSLHHIAKEVEHSFGGVIPSDYQTLLSLKGLGPYTASAIAAFAYGERCIAIDGNVERVLSRFFLIDTDLTKSAGKKRLKEKSLNFLREGTPDMAEALIELGALVCQKKAKCSLCPLKKECLAHQEGKQDSLPFKGEKKESIKLLRTVFVFQCEREFFIEREEKKGVMRGLYQFPYVDEAIDPILYIEEKKLPFLTLHPLQKEKQTFTKYRVDLFPYLITLKERFGKAECWKTKEEIENLPLCSGHKRVFRKL